MVYSFFRKRSAALLLVLVMLHAHADAQSRLCLNYQPGSIDINVPRAEMDSLLHPELYDAFFYGETHTRYFEPTFKLHLVKWLHAGQSVRDIFMEIGFAPAVVFNKFLETGDTSLIKIKVLYTTPYYMEFWKQLYRYNKDLPAQQKIRIHGGDFEATTAFFHALLLLVPDQTEITDSLAAIFQKIRSYSDRVTMSAGEFAENVKEVKSVFHIHRDQIAKLYGNNYGMVRKILDNDISMMDKSRDLKMYRHLQEELAEYNITRFVVFLGGDHINYAYKTSLPNQLKKNKKWANKILTIRGVYFDAYDNWSQQTVECIGVYDEKEGHTLHERYRDNACRATLVPAGFKDDILKKSADVYLFAQDQSAP